MFYVYHRDASIDQEHLQHAKTLTHEHQIEKRQMLVAEKMQEKQQKKQKVANNI